MYQNIQRDILKVIYIDRNNTLINHICIPNLHTYVCRERKLFVYSFNKYVLTMEDKSTKNLMVGYI